MNPQDFANPSGNLVVRTDRNGPFHSFIPNPLPPDLALSSQIISKLSNADRAIGKLEGLSLLVPNPRLFAPLMHREALLSARIEGTITTYSEVYALEAGQLELFEREPGKKTDDPKEVLNYVIALEYGLDKLKNDPLTLKLFKQIHAQLLKGVRGEDSIPGEFRRLQNAIGNPDDTIQNAKFVPAPVPEMIKGLNDLEVYLNEGNLNPPLIKLALIHYQFEAIHPFRDGNGRLGRLIIPLLLQKWEILTHPLLYLSVFFEHHRQQYYEQLYNVSAKSNWNEWISFFLDGVIEQSNDSVNQANRILALQQEWKDRLEKIKATASWLIFADHLFRRPITSIPQAATRMRFTYKAAENMIQKFIAAGILRQLETSSRPKYFVAPEILGLF